MLDYEYLEKLINEVESTKSKGLVVPPQEGRNGTAYVKNGQILVQDPDLFGKPASIKPGENVVIFVNGRLIKDSVTVTEKDEIEVYTENTPGDRSLNLSIADSGLSASLRVNYSPAITYKLVEVGPDQDITVQAEPESTKEPERFSIEEILDYLRKNGVTYGIDLDVVAELAEKGGHAIVAKGDPPTLGTDAKIELLFPTEVFKHKPKNESALKVDVLDQYEIIQVKPGDLLARKTPPTPGKPGTTVTGKPIFPPESKDKDLRTNEGAKLSEDGLKVFATSAGLPRLKNNIISVLPIYEHLGDLDPRHGHLTFDGHVIIRGNVSGGVKLTASGDVLILGSITESEVIAGGNLTVKKAIISSSVKAGGQDAPLSSIVTKLEVLSNEIGLLAKAINQVLTNPKFTQVNLTKNVIGHLATLLLEKKFASIPSEFHELIKLCKDTSRQNICYILEACSTKFLRTNAMDFSSVQEIHSIENLIRAKAKALSEEINAPANLKFDYAQNSNLQASGSIYCIGTGCYDCQLYAGREVKVIGREGYFRGQKIVAGGDIHVADLGNPSGQETIVEFSPKAVLRADIVRNNVLIRSGRQSSKIIEDKRLLKSWVDYKGHLNVSTLKFKAPKRVREA